MAKYYVLPTSGPWVPVEAARMSLYEDSGLLIFHDDENNVKHAFSPGHWQRVSKINPEPAK